MTSPPDSHRSICRRISASMPRAMWLNEFMFLSSVRVRYPVSPRSRTDTLASARSVPFSISASEMPSSTIVWRSNCRKRFASSALRRSGCVTISTSGVPPRLKSTFECAAPTMRPVAPPTWIVLAASSSRCARMIPTSASPSGPGTAILPFVQRGSSYCEIW